MIEGNIPGWQDVVSWFGFEQTFHDSEVVSIDLRRDPEPSVMRIHAFRVTRKTDEKGYYVLDRHAIVSFHMSGITHQELVGWNDRNYLFSLDISRTDDGLRIHMETSYGVAGTLCVKELRFTIEPKNE